MNGATPSKFDRLAESVEAARSECEVDKEAGDFVVDLNEADGHNNDFYGSRQLLPRLYAILRQGVQP